MGVYNLKYMDIPWAPDQQCNQNQNPSHYHFNWVINNVRLDNRINGMYSNLNVFYLILSFFVTDIGHWFKHSSYIKLIVVVIC